MEIEIQKKKRHVKQIGLKCFPEDMRIIERIKKEQGFKNDSEAIRYAMFLVEANSLLEKRLENIESRLDGFSKDIENLCWRSNDASDMLLKISRKLDTTGK